MRLSSYRVTNDFGEDRFLNVEIYLKNRKRIVNHLSRDDSCCKTIRTGKNGNSKGIRAPFFPSIISRGRHSRIPLGPGFFPSAENVSSTGFPSRSVHVRGGTMEIRSQQNFFGSSPFTDPIVSARRRFFLQLEFRLSLLIRSL